MGEGDDFRTIMACHYSPGPECEGGERFWPCVWYLAQHGYSNLNCRVAAMNGEYDLPAIVEAAKSWNIWPDFPTMLAAYEEALE